MSRYTWNGINTGTLPSHCERISEYWSKLACMDQYASGKAMGQRFKAARAFKAGLRARGLSEDQINRAYQDTLDLARLKMAAE